MSNDSNTIATDNELSALQDNIETKGKNSYYFAHAHKANGPKWDGKPQPRLLSKHSTSSVSSNVNNNNSDGVGGDGDGAGSTTADADANANATIDHPKAIIDDENIQTLLKSLKGSVVTKSSHAFSRSNISKYAFLDEGKKVKIYVELKGVGDRCKEDGDVTLDWDEESLCLLVQNYDADKGDDDGDIDNSEEKEDSSSNKQQQKQPKCLSFGKLYGLITKASFKKKQDRIIITLVKKVEKEGKDPDEWSAVGAKGGGDM